MMLVLIARFRRPIRPAPAAGRAGKTIVAAEIIVEGGATRIVTLTL